MDKSLEIISNFIFTSKYARYLPGRKRRETWNECIDRVKKMHLKKFNHLAQEHKDEIKQVFDLVKEKRIVPSMRSLQFAGVAIDAHHSRLFNCAVRQVDSPRSFSEIFYLLMCGCGVGLGLTKKYVNLLPRLVSAADKTGTVINYTCEDSIEGWSDSIEALLDCYFKNTPLSGRKIVFDYSKIRKKGAPLKTGGGKAPGYLGLKKCHKKVKKLLDRIIEDLHQDRLKPIDAYDILMFTSDAVLSGGIRRSATIAIFDPDDEEMMNAKTGDWFKENPQRARSNNSILLQRDKTSLDQFKDIIDKTKQYGEPGAIFANSEDVLYNPCAEIAMEPGYGATQFCNLTSINGAQIKSLTDFQECIKAATVIGTLQAAYTDFDYLGHASKEITEEEALLGVSITGITDNPDILLNEQNLRDGAKLAVDENFKWSRLLGINQAARITCVKPEGTSSLVLGSASGVHPHHSHQYIRRVQCNKEDPVYQFFKKHNPHMCEESIWSANKTDDVISFPIEISENAIVKKDLSALEHLEIIKKVQQNWVIPGTTESNKKPINHNVSCTVIVDENEWQDVAEYLYTNREYFSAVSLLPKTGDKDYKQAPLESIVTEDDKILFQSLKDNSVEVSYTKLIEDEDITEVQATAACAGGICEVPSINTK